MRKINLVLFGLCLLLSPVFACIGFGEDRKLTIYESELTRLIQLSQTLKSQLSLSLTDSQKLRFTLENLSNEAAGLQMESLQLLERAELSELESAALSVQLTNLQDSWAKFRDGSETQIKRLEGERNLGIAAGIGGIIIGIILGIAAL
jgi:hypothetical protein